MRMAPRDVSPIYHQGVRYEAPHFIDFEEATEPVLTPRQRMLSVLHTAAQGGDLQRDPTWCRDVLSQAGFESFEIERMLQHLELERKVGQVLRDSMQELMMKALTEGSGFDPLAQLSPEWLYQALEKEGSLTAEQRRQAVENWQSQMQSLREAAQRPACQNGGYLVAYDQATEQRLWWLRVYETSYDLDLEQDVQDVFITALSIDDEGYLLVRDERRRIYRIDLSRRQIVSQAQDQNPTPEDIARRLVKGLPEAQRKQLGAALWELKGNMDSYNISAFARQSRPQEALLDSLEKFLSLFASAKELHPLLQSAWDRGKGLAQEIRAGQDGHVLYEWLQEELALVWDELFSAD